MRKLPAIELWVLPVEGEFCLEVIDVFGDETAVALQAVTSTGGPLQTVEPSNVGLCLLQDDGMAFLEDLMHSDECLECLDFIGHDGLAVVSISTSHMPQRRSVDRRTHTFMPCQKEAELL